MQAELESQGTRLSHLESRNTYSCLDSDPRLFSSSLFITIAEIDDFTAGSVPRKPLYMSLVAMILMLGDR